MANQTIFKRYEYKYLLTADQKKDLQAYMETYMKPDAFGRNTICNLYFDTPDPKIDRRKGVQRKDPAAYLWTGTG